MVQILIKELKKNFVDYPKTSKNDLCQNGSTVKLCNIRKRIEQIVNDRERGGGE